MKILQSPKDLKNFILQEKRHMYYIQEKCPSATYATPSKYAKYSACARPAFSTTQSDIGLKEFLEQDRI